MQIEYEGFYKRTEYHYSILLGVFQVSCYLYFTTGKQWSKDLLNIKRVFISQRTSMARARVKIMIAIKDNDTQGVDL